MAKVGCNLPYKPGLRRMLTVRRSPTTLGDQGMRKAIAAITTMLAGGILYVSFRAESLAMFSWFNALGVNKEVQVLRLMAGPPARNIPHWVYFSLPQALWYFSGLLAFACIWGVGDNTRWQRQVWLLAFSATALGLELGQFFHLVPVRFDPLDLALLVVAWSVAAIIIFAERRESVKQLEGYR